MARDVTRSALAAFLTPSPPRQIASTPPCAQCAAGGDPRAWIAQIAQSAKLGVRHDEAMSRAWQIVTAMNPFPASLGRICPHPCEADCNRLKKDEAVAIHAMERYLGDWGLAHRLPLPVLARAQLPESVGVIGSGPSGLSFAYQMGRRGYRVTVYEEASEAGGMLRYGIPEYRLPEAVLRAEIERLGQFPITIRTQAKVHSRAAVEYITRSHDALFVGIGAGVGKPLGIPGEAGDGCCTGAEYLRRVNQGEPVEFRGGVVVVGGGNTAIDAARTARRSGAPVTLLYRRTRAEMPAIASEIDEALQEGVQLECLAAPIEIVRDAGHVIALRAQRMELGSPDASGRRAPVPVDGEPFVLRCCAVIAAVSQHSDWSGLDDLWQALSAPGTRQPFVLTGGDVVKPSIAADAIAQGRRAAEIAHARMRGIAAPSHVPPVIGVINVKPELYPSIGRVRPKERAPAARLAQSDVEVRATIGRDELLAEAARCFSCGYCLGCKHCFMYCNPGAFLPRERARPGDYFALDTHGCEGCRKCVDTCPCGFLQ